MLESIPPGAWAAIGAIAGAVVAAATQRTLQNRRDEAHRNDPDRQWAALARELNRIKVDYLKQSILLELILDTIQPEEVLRLRLAAERIFLAEYHARTAEPKEDAR